MTQDELPEGWSSAAVSETCERVVVGFVGPSAKHYSQQGVPFLTGKNVRPGRLALTDFERVTKAFHERELKSQLFAGDVVVVRIGRSGEAAVVPETLGEANCGGLVIAKRPRAVRPGYLAWYLNSPPGQSQLLEEVRGVTRQTLNTKSIARAVLPLPPVAEQERIVAKVEELLARVKAARDRLARVPAMLRRFRQAVLAAACEGKLTDANLEEWREATLEGVGKWFTGGTPSRSVATNFGGGIPWVKSGELRDGLVTETSETLSRAGVASSAAKLMPKGTVSVALYGATIGKVGVLGLEATTNQACANCVVNDRVIDRWFLFYFLTQQRDQLIEAGQGGAQPNLTNQIVRSWPLRLPPISEQREIVRRVEALFKLADAVEKRVAAATARAEKLTHAILAKAFRGELVPTEAELARREGRAYEPASALLGRIRAESAGAGTSVNRRKRQDLAGHGAKRTRAQISRRA